jgi:hypothetical protein
MLSEHKKTLFFFILKDIIVNIKRILFTILLHSRREFNALI